MKVIISEKILTELNIFQKNKDKYVSHGGYQYVFKSSDPDKLIKFGRNNRQDTEEVVDNKNIIGNYIKRKYNPNELHQFQEMQKHPECFVKIFKITSNFIIVEKLDADRAKKEYLAILDVLRPRFNITFQQLLQEFKSVNGNPDKMMEYFYDAHKWLEKNLPRELVPAYYRFMTLVAEIEKLGLFEIDINAGNFGYDKTNKLKMLDV